MLILSRKRGESILIGEDIEVFVTEIRDGKVRLGIIWLTSLSIHRKERYRVRRVESSCSDSPLERALFS